MHLLASLLVTAVLLVYFYYQDHNREPLSRVIEAFILGGVISLQVTYFQVNIPFSPHIIVQAFIVSSLVEELIKLAALRFTLFRNPDFTAPSDGITYAVFLAMGFATVENIALIHTMEIGIIRAFTATPAHALFAVSMGYYLGRYRFERDIRLLVLAFAVPFVLHGLYNLLILSESTLGLLLFLPYIIVLWVKSSFKIDRIRK